MTEAAPVDFVCEDCGRRVVEKYPFTRRCAACTVMPGWYRDPVLAKRIDPNYQPKGGSE